MKFDLIVKDASATDVSRILALFGGTAIATSVVQTEDDDDDNNGQVVDHGTGTVDATGLPWDERIHSKNKTQTDAGAWRAKKGVSADLVKQVEAELRSRGVPAQTPPPMFDQGTQQPTQAPAPVMPMPPVNQQPAPQMQPPVQQQQPVVTQPVQMPPVNQQPAPQMQPPVQQAPAPVAKGMPADFSGFMQGLQQSMDTKRDANGVPTVTPEYLAKIVGEFNQAYQAQLLGNITDLANHTDKIGYMVQLMQRDGTW